MNALAFQCGRLVRKQERKGDYCGKAANELLRPFPWDDKRGWYREPKQEVHVRSSTGRPP